MPDKKNTIGRFEIIEKIGEGPIGSVYKALDPVIRRTVAIKVIKLYALEETTTFAEVFEKIYRVVRTSTALNHPNICIIYDLSEEKKIPYITMEYVEGQDVESLLRQKHQFKRPELLNVLQQACDALDFAHKKNVIHQDLKSTNILVTPDLQVKITDFGIAGLDEIAAAQTKKLLSIPYYISPEQALGERVSPASDLFSLGVVIYHLLSGQLPFPGTTAANTIMMIARDTAAVPSNLNKSAISKDDWNSFFGIALAKSANQRFRSAREMLEALNSILPASDQTYYPFGFEGIAIDSTGKFEKTYIAEDAEPASPTLMIDASQIMEDRANPVAASSIAEEEEIPFIDAGTAEFIPVEDQITGPVSVSADESSAATLLEMPTQPPPQEEKIPETTPMEHTLEPLPVEEMEPPLEMESQKTEMLQNPFVPMSVESSTQPKIEPQPPADFVPASGNFLDDEVSDSDEIATIAPTPVAEIAEKASDTSPIVHPSEEKPRYDEITEPPISAPTQLLKTPSLDASSGNGRGAIPVESVPATMISSFQPPVPEPTPAPTAFVPPPSPPPAPAPPAPVSAPTKIMQEVHPLAASADLQQQVPQPKRPAPPPPAAPVHPLTRPMDSSSGAPAAKPPAMQRYFFGAIAAVLFIAVVGGAILFFRKPADVDPTPTPEPPKTTTKTTDPQPKPTPTDPAPLQVADTGSMMITSEPTGATVFVAGQEKGVTPVEVPQLSFGKHQVKLKLKGYQDLEQEIELTAENPNQTLPSFKLSKVAAAMGTLIIESEPSGAFIVIANRVMGVTPKSFPRKPGTYDITLKKDGYLDYSGNVKVAQDKKITFSGTLQEIPKPAPPVEQPKPKPPEVTRGQLVTLGPDVIPPKPVHKVYAKYPESAKAKKLEGTVRLNVLVDETGRVLDVKVTKSAHPMLDDAVMAAYRQWTFAPATKQGVPVKVWITVSMSFQSGR